MKDTTTERVGRYQLLEPIGMGPCGRVSRAKVFGVAGFERQFAVKKFHTELTITAALAQALSAAARAYGSLEHPRIARMSEFGVAQGQTFTAVELVPGLDALRLIGEARLASTTLAAGGALALVSQAARAVGYAHGRGLTHLGLAPTNVIITVEGDIKITDFGVLAAGLPQRPIDVARLAQRIAYLAPEQLTNEAASAATDVFALGVLAYELVTGQRAFRGETPQQIAQAILAGPPPEPPLPRPIVRVLQRCLARSPFERFPDARALADALDAALRVAPVPGTRKDIGALVKEATDRIAALHDGDMSGVLALNLGTGPVRRDEAAPEVATLGRDSVLDLATSEFVRPDTPVAGPAPLTGPATTMPDLQRPITTMAGLPPPPIPVPPGVVGPPSIPRPPPTPGSQTLLGIAGRAQPGTIPPIKPPTIPIPRIPANERARVPSSEIPSIPANEPARIRASEPPPRLPTSEIPHLPLPPPNRPSTPPNPRLETNAPTTVDAPPLDAMFPDEPSIKRPIDDDYDDSQTPLPPPNPDRQHDFLTTEMPPVLAVKLGAASAATETSEIEPLVRAAYRADAEAAFPDQEASAGSIPSLAARPNTATKLGAPPPLRPSTPAPNEASLPTPGAPRPTAPAKRRGGLIVGIALGVAALGIGGWQLYTRVLAKPSSASATAAVAPPANRAAQPDATQVAIATVDASAVTTTTDATRVATAPADAAKLATSPADAARPVPADAAQLAIAPADAAKAAPADAAKAAPTATPTGTSDQLVITSTPAGAHVYLDGADSGVTPLKLPGTADRHTVALLLAGHELYIAKVDGHGSFAIPLKETTPSAGPAGIKVIKCKDKDRIYVFVDGKPTGQTCPTERIEVNTGPHTVEIYDAVTESRKKWDIVVKDTRLSYRVRVE